MRAAQPATFIAQHAAVAAEADFAMLWDSHEAGQAVVTGVSGALAANLMNRTAPLADCPAGQAILTGQPAFSTATAAKPPPLLLGADIGPLIVVPLAAGGKIRGALGLGRLATAPEFTGSTWTWPPPSPATPPWPWKLAEARADQITLAQVEDHDRIAAELHDHVIQELFALGMKLQGHVEPRRSGHRAADQRIRRRPGRDHQQDPHQHLRAPPVRGPYPAACTPGSWKSSKSTRLSWASPPASASPGHWNGRRTRR